MPAKPAELHRDVVIYEAIRGRRGFLNSAFLRFVRSKPKRPRKRTSRQLWADFSQPREDT